MAASSDRSSPRGFPIRESRSLHDLFSGFFFNHVDHSRTISTTGDQKSSPFWGGGGDDGVSSDSSAVALVFGRNSSSDFDESRLIDSMAEVTCAVKSSRMRRSDTWDDSLLLRKSGDPFQPEDVSPSPLPPSSGPSPSLPSVRSTSGVISFVASGGAGDTGSGLRGLLADIFNPNGTGSRSTSAGSRSTSAGSDPAAAAADAVSASTTLTLGSSGGGNTCSLSPAADDFSLLPTSPKHLSKVRRQLTLPAVLEGGDPGSVDAEEKRIITKVDVTHSNAVPEKTPPLQGTSAPPNSPCGVPPAKASEADLLALPEAMKTPAAKPRPPPPSPRKFGILELFAAGERRSVRNRDINAMAPQSW